MNNDISPKKGNKANSLKSAGLNVAARAIRGGLSGGVGRGIQKGAEAALGGAMYAGANRLARRQRLKAIRKKRAMGMKGGLERPKKRLTGPGFLIVALFALSKDVLDIILLFTVFFSPLIILTGLMISFTILFYLLYNRVKPSVRKVVSGVVAAFIEMSPFAFIPTTTLVLFFIRWTENNDRMRAFIEKKAKIIKGLSRVGI